jgi:hypothetical protein
MNSMDAVSTIIMYTSNFGSDNVTILLFTGRAQADRTMMDGWYGWRERRSFAWTKHKTVRDVSER